MKTLIMTIFAFCISACTLDPMEDQTEQRASDDPQTVLTDEEQLPAVDLQGSNATETRGVIEIFPSGKTNTVVNVGGGTWNYGRSGSHCWSHYVHPAKRHSATAIQGPANVKRYASAGLWANADIYDGSGTCYAYWNTY